MVLRIIAVSILLLLIPAGFGSVLAFRYNRIERSDILSIYTYGICLFYAAFSVIAIGMTMLRRSFHEAVIAGKLLSGVSLVLFVLMCAMRWKTERLGSFFRWLVHIRRLLVRYWWILLPAGVILFQIIRSVIRTTSVYSDDDTYMSIILDMIRTDTLLGTDPATGGLHNYSTYANPKFLLTAWMQFLAFLSSASGIHPLILVKSVLPVFFISWHYMVIWKLTYYLSRDYNKRIGILIFYTLLMEFGSPSLNTDLSYYLFTWNWYGKSVLQFFLIPMVILFFLSICSIQTGWREGLMLMMLIVAGLGLSSMSLILLTIMVTAFVLLECVEKRSVREMWIMVPALVPLAVNALFYFTMF